MRHALMAVLTMMAMLAGCAQQTKPMGPRETTSYTPGSVGTSGGADVGYFAPEYHSRLERVLNYLEEQKNVDDTEYKAVRSRLIQAATQLSEVINYPKDFNKRVVKEGKGFIVLDCRSGSVAIEAQDLWLGRDDERFSYEVLLKAMGRLGNISLSKYLMDVLTEDLVKANQPVEL